MDVYLPQSCLSSASLRPEDAAELLAGPDLPGASNRSQLKESSSNRGAPVLLFVHGGVWATGERWHYAPMATRLAQAGVVACVMSYSLYPKAMASDMVHEVSSALTWVLAHCSRMGGDKTNVTLAGHSAGKQATRS